MKYRPREEFAGGVTYNYKGKEIPMMVLNSSKGSLTSELLDKILKRLNDLEIFPQGADLPPPGLLVDRHGSRLGLPKIKS